MQYSMPADTGSGTRRPARMATAGLVCQSDADFGCLERMVPVPRHQGYQLKESRLGFPARLPPASGPRITHRSAAMSRRNGTFDIVLTLNTA